MRVNWLRIYISLFHILFLVIDNPGFAQNNIPDNLDQYIEGILQDFQVPGLAVAVVKDGEIILAEGFGIKEINNAEKVDENTVFGIASVSKTTVALSLAMLVEENKIHWDDPVIKYLPDFQMYDPWVTREITIRDLLVHKSGLPYNSGGTIWFGSDLSREEIVHRIRFIKPESSFRSKYVYQNIMYVVAGQIIKAVSGKTWDVYVEEKVFAPLEMNNSSTTYSALINHSNVAKPHALLDGKLIPINYRSYDNCGPSGAMNSSVTDLAKYMIMFLNKGKVHSEQLISENQLNEIFAPQTIISSIKFPPGMEFANPAYEAHGLGCFILEYRGYKVVYHPGGIDGFRCLLTMIPEKKLGIVVLTNQEEKRAMMTLTYKMVDHYLGFPEFNWKNVFIRDRDWQAENHKKAKEEKYASRIPDTKSSFKLEKYCGTYRDSMYGDVFVRLENNKLIISFSHTPSFTAEMEHWHYDTFSTDWIDPVIPNGLVTFVMNSTGNIAELRLDQPDLLDVCFSELKLICVSNE
jgi:CubicO group peptidase (beta-lactamase class C family)